MNWVRDTSVGAIVALALPAAPPAGGAVAAASAYREIPAYREIKDWVLVCDNARSCRARSAPEEDGVFSGSLDVARAAGASGRLAVTLEEAEADAAPQPATLALDGRPIGAGLRWAVDVRAQTASLQGADALGLVRALREGAMLSYSVGQDRRTVSLKGLKAALLAMDEAQGRLGSTGAAVAMGGRLESTVPPPPPLPVIVARPAPPGLAAPPGFAAAVRRAQQRRGLQASQCEDDFTRADAAYPLNKDEVLVLLGCVQGAYQSAMLAFRAPRRAPQRAAMLVLPPPPGAPPAGKDPGAYVSEDGWDPKTATLTDTARGRGLADCGATARWTFDGARFRLSYAARLDRCSGGPPGDWPVTWRSRVEAPPGRR